MSRGTATNGLDSGESFVAARVSYSGGVVGMIENFSLEGELWGYNDPLSFPPYVYFIGGLVQG